MFEKCSHPNIEKVWEIGEDDFNYYILVKNTKRYSLLHYINERQSSYYGAITEKEISQIVIQILSALNYMHRKGHVHSNLSLENIILVDKEKDN